MLFQKKGKTNMDGVPITKKGKVVSWETMAALVKMTLG